MTKVRVEPGGSLPARWSASAVSGYLSCPLRFWFARVAGWREPDSEAQVVGRVVHGVLEDLLSTQTGHRDPSSVQGLTRTRLDEFVPNGSELNRGSVQAKSEAALANYFAVEPDPNTVNVLPGGLERQLSVAVDGVPFLGYVDRMSLTSCDLVRVTDYKTGSSAAEHLPEKWRQQLLYAAALGELGEPVDEVELLFTGAEPRSTVRPVYPRALRRARDDLRNAVDSAVNSLAASKWDALRSPLCGWCAFAYACPAQARRAPKPGTPESDAVLSERGLVRRSSHTPRPPDLHTEVLAEEQGEPR